jgi:hypothetical protein
MMRFTRPARRTSIGVFSMSTLAIGMASISMASIGAASIGVPVAAVRTAGGMATMRPARGTAGMSSVRTAGSVTAGHRRMARSMVCGTAAGERRPAAESGPTGEGGARPVRRALGIGVRGTFRGTVRTTLGIPVRRAFWTGVGRTFRITVRPTVHVARRRAFLIGLRRTFFVARWRSFFISGRRALFIGLGRPLFLPPTVVVAAVVVLGCEIAGCKHGQRDNRAAGEQ